MARVIVAAALALSAAAAGAQPSAFSLGGELSGIGLAWSNAGLCMVPILAWNLALTPRLSMDRFPGTVPGWYDAAENVLRGAAMLYPFLRPLDAADPLFKPGLALYAAGTALYFASWLPLMAKDPAPWMKSLAVQLAPAYTPVLWFAGISLMADSPVELGLSFLFAALHVGEYLMRWRPRA
jgi:hypothetical protein